jgi:polyferredoxin
MVMQTSCNELPSMSSMSAQRSSGIVWLRRGVQTGFLLLFLYLFLQTVYHPINIVGGRATFFFDLDPLVMMTAWLAVHAVVPAMMLSLVTLAVTAVFGRWFCGWVCPFGALHNLLTGLRSGKLKTKLDSGGYSRWQRSKYYVLAFFLGGALVGLNLVGWLDPFSFFYRSLATVVFPMANLAAQKFFGWIYQVNPGIGAVRVTAVTEPVYEVLRRYFLAVRQPHYFWSLFIGLLFGAMLALNFLRARFFCRYICPLGALLGITGKNPTLRLVTDPSACNDCRLCVVDCQGGANPQGKAPWKPAECFYCWNCHSSCPSEAIAFRFEVPGRKAP